MIHKKYENLKYAEDIARCFGAATYGVIHEARKLGYNISRNEALDYNIIKILISVYEEKQLLTKSFQEAREENDKQFRKITSDIEGWRENERNKILSTLIKVKKYTDVHKAAEIIVSDSDVEFYTDPMLVYYIEKILVENEYIINHYNLFSKISGNSFFLKDLSLAEQDRYINKSKIYINDQLLMFSKFISEFSKKYRVKIPSWENDVLLFSYLLIKDTAINLFSNRWDKEYGGFFKDINKLSLINSIERYCTIDSFDHESQVYLGTFVYYLMKNKKFEGHNEDFIGCSEYFLTKFRVEQQRKKYDTFLTRLKIDNNQNKIKYTINDIDLMTGLEFENFVVELFQCMGYSAEITKATGDQGIDVIASKNGQKFGIQAKKYSSSVGNSAIQEVVAGKNHYKLDKAIVITNSFFTKSAKNLAMSNHVLLWDRDLLKTKIDEIF